MNRRRLVPVVMCALWLGGCASVPSHTPTLYEQLGGEHGVAAITSNLLDAFARDPQVAPSFDHVDINRFQAYFADYICQIADGPCRYKGDSMAAVHRGMHINAAMFNAVVEDLIAAMNRQRVPVRVQNRLLARLAPERKDIVYH
ncbi:MAG: group 1 truncated hemoglobin [Rhodanobacter sp.]